MDVLFIGLKNESLYRFGISPNKIFDYMMASKPIIQLSNQETIWLIMLIADFQ